MTSSDTDTTAGTSGKRSDAFAAAVSEKKLKADGAARDGLARGLGIALMIIGVLGAFAAWNASMGQDDSRDIASSQILAIAFLGITATGGALFVAGALARVLRLWLLRQLVESQDRMDELVEALRENTPGR
jgi:hypothetical protein